MKDSLFHYWDRLSRREKLACGAAACVLLLYATYALVLENSMRDAMGKSVRLARLDAEYHNLLSSRQRREGLKGELATLTLELEKKMGEERLLAEGVQSRRPVEFLLHELRQTAGKMPLQLVSMDIKTGAIQTERANYTVSKIALSYRSSYTDSVSYFVKVMDLPYAISVNAVEMERINVAGTGVGGAKRHIDGAAAPDGSTPLNTKLGVEIFHR